MSFGCHEIPDARNPDAGFKEGYPQIAVSLEGVVTIRHAPDEATFSWYLINSDDINKNIIHREKNRITFIPTTGEPVTYKITGYNMDNKRFTGERIYE